MSEELQKLVILHTNDIHSHFDQMPKVAAYFRQVKEVHQPDSVLILDIGDHMDRAAAITEGTDGMANVEIMNASGYEAMVLGNNEGLTFTSKTLGDLFREQARFPVIGSNMLQSSTQQSPDWMQPYHIVQKAGLRVGLLGVTANFTDFYNLLDWNVQDPLQMTAYWAERIRPQVDVLIVLSHLGFQNDQRLAAEVEGIDLILGGHTHHVLEAPLQMGNTYICAAGKFGQYVGEVYLEYDLQQKRMKKLQGHLVQVSSIEGESSIEALIDHFTLSSQASLDKEVAWLPRPLLLDWYAESQLGNLLAAGLRRWTGAEIGLVNAGQLLQGLDEGKVTRGRMLEICPGPINPCRILLSGEHLLQALEESLLEQYTQKPIRGFGFRGEVLGVLCTDGIQMKVDDSREPYGKIVNLWINGEPLDRARHYVVGTIDMFTFGVGYLSLSKGSSVEYILPEFLRDVLTIELQNKSALRSSEKRHWIRI